jgi:hypothetical protein
VRVLRKAVILAHRYLGLGLGLLVVVWFASGIVMMYAGGMPELTEEMRLERLPQLDLTRIMLTPAEAVERASVVRAAPRRGRPSKPPPNAGARLSTVMGRPAYRIGAATVFADTGELLGSVTVAESRQIAARFLGVSEGPIRHVGTLTRTDQWTLGQGRSLPLHKFRVDDDSATEVYVEPRIGDVVTLTTRRSRMLAWMGTIPHWLYFAALRSNQPLWYRLVVWTSAVACVLAVLGLVLSVTQLRKNRPFRLASAIPYAGWMRWHYITGAIFGVFTLTWAYSGLLSMEPFAWTNATGLELPRDVFTGGSPDLSKFAALDPTKWQQVVPGRAIKEVDFSRIQDEHYYVVRLAPRLHQAYDVRERREPDRVLVHAERMEVRREPFSVDSLLARLRAARPDVSMADATLLKEYDSYYYSRGGVRPLPILRVKFNDPEETWLYVDPETSRIAGLTHRLGRIERWLYNGLHSLDFGFWYDRRPLWDVGMIVLLLGGLATSVLGLFVGVRRLVYKSRRESRSTGVTNELIVSEE